MSRGPRLDVEGGVYHVMARGVERRAIFRDDTDRQNFLRRLEAVAEEEDLAVFAYVLMDNHFHVVARRGAARALFAPPVDGPQRRLQPAPPVQWTSVPEPLPGGALRGRHLPVAARRKIATAAKRRSCATRHSRPAGTGRGARARDPRGRRHEQGRAWTMDLPVPQLDRRMAQSLRVLCSRLRCIWRSCQHSAVSDQRDELEDLLGRRVDLVTEKALKPRMRLQVERETIYVA